MTYLFDLDNTLYDESQYLNAVHYELAKKYDIPTEEFSDYNEVSRKHDIELSEILELRRSIVLPYKLSLFKEMFNFIKARQAEGHTIFIVTNGNVQQQKNKVRQIDWQGLDNINIIYANKIFPKPDLRLWRHLQRAYGLKRNDTIMIGDSEVDKQFAQNAGIEFIWSIQQK